ncbi:hypothetical protein OPQ81_005563 [Rhizoctonia solani]|nr:hypothetical protein OPQ81_005563 [Rhizoctonia solani]
MHVLPIRNLNYRFPILGATRKSIYLRRRIAATGHPTPTELPLVASRRLQTVSKHINASQSEMEITASASPQPSLIDQLGPFSTCEISDALIKLGLTHNANETPVQRGGYIPDINMLSPSPTVGDGQNTRVCGYAYTVKMVRGDDLQAPKPSRHFVDAAPPGSIAVISVPPNVKSAAWGGLMTAGAQFRGVRGVVIDGRARDLIEHRAAGFPVFARGHSTLGQSPFTRPSELNVPVTILPRPDFENAFENTFSAVEVYPGDIVVADIDGVVCIPPELLANVIDSCRYSKQVDEKCMIDIQQGRSVQETFQRWRKATNKKVEFAPATAPATANYTVNAKSPVTTSVSPRVAARNVLKSTIGLIPRTLPLEHQKLWETKVRNSLNELETGRRRTLRVAVWGDVLSGASEIVTGLLDDPLSEDVTQRNLLRQRWTSAPQNGVIHIRRDSVASLDGQILGIKSNWLQNINGEIIECRDSNALDILLSCDHVILVTDNLRRLSAPGLQEIIQGLTHAPSVSLVVTERAPGIPTSANEFADTQPVIIKPDLAIKGLDAFTQGDVNQYQSLLMASGLPQFAQRVSTLCTESNQPSSPSSTASRAAVRTSTHIARVTLSACEAAVNSAQQSLASTLGPLESLKAEVSSISLDAVHSTLRGSKTVHEGIPSVETRLRAAFRRLPWYSLWWRADEVSGTLGESISWSTLGTQLSFHSGRLASIREQMHNKAIALAAVSPLLSNRLAQIHARTSIDPNSLSSPLVQRTAQLLAPGGPVEDVQRKAQAAVIATAANILGSGALSAGLFAIGSISGGTAVGAGLLGGVASIRWMQSIWARAENRWWADWSRVCAGLERDCEANLNQVRPYLGGRICPTLGYDTALESHDRTTLYISLSVQRLHGPVYFWKPEQEHGYLSPWYHTQFKSTEPNGSTFTYQSAEQYLIHRKGLLFAPNSPVTHEVLKTNSPAELRSLSHKIPNYDEAAWVKQQISVITMGNYLKFNQDPGLKGLLLGTGSRELVEANPYDRVWGIGYDAKEAAAHHNRWGDNLMGKALMSVRKAIKSGGHPEVIRPTVTFDSAVYFNTPEQDYGFLSRWHVSKFTSSRFTYRTVQQYMAHRKGLLFAPNSSYTAAILDTTNPSALLKLSGQIPNFNEAVWQRERIRLLMTANWLRFTQDSSMKARLLGTKSRELVECDPNDRYLGVGYDVAAAPINRAKWGSNFHGKVLMQVRKLIVDSEASLVTIADKIK